MNKYLIFFFITIVLTGCVQNNHVKLPPHGYTTYIFTDSPLFEKLTTDPGYFNDIDVAPANCTFSEANRYLVTHGFKLKDTYPKGKVYFKLKPDKKDKITVLISTNGWTVVEDDKMGLDNIEEKIRNAKKDDEERRKKEGK